MCEGTDNLNSALSSAVTSLWVRVASARNVGWGRNEAVTFLFRTFPKCSDKPYANTSFSNIIDNTPLTSISIAFFTVPQGI
jgi:hypothetical protein